MKKKRVREREKWRKNKDTNKDMKKLREINCFFDHNREVKEQIKNGARKKKFIATERPLWKKIAIKSEFLFYLKLKRKEKNRLRWCRGKQRCFEQ